MLESTASATIRDTTLYHRVVDRVGSSFRVGVPVKVGIRFTPLSYIVSLRMHPLPARIQKFLTQRIELMLISVVELKTKEL